MAHSCAAAFRSPKYLSHFRLLFVLPVSFSVPSAEYMYGIRKREESPLSQLFNEKLTSRFMAPCWISFTATSQTLDLSACTFTNVSATLIRLLRIFGRLTTYSAKACRTSDLWPLNPPSCQMRNIFLATLPTSYYLLLLFFCLLAGLYDDLCSQVVCLAFNSLRYLCA